MLTVALQQGINGVVIGSLYVLVALGLTLIYGVLVQINFAHADIVTIGAFAAYFFTFLFGGNYLVSIGVALMVGAALGWLVNATIFAPLRERGSELLPLIATIGVSILLQNAMLLWFGPIPYAFDSPYSNQVIRLWGGTFITWQNVIIVVVSTLTIVLVYAFMRFTITGKALRAVAQDRETAGLMGINPDQLIMLTFVSAYASTLLITKLGVPFWVAFVLAIVLSGTAGMALSIFAVRLRGHYLAIASLAFAVIVHQILLNWISLTQGPLGIYAIKPPPEISLPGLALISFSNTANMFYLVAGFAFLCYLLLDQLVRSPIGETLAA